MALVLPVLRLWLLLVNLYGTFKAMKPPPLSQRGTRNGQGPSARAMQLRKRELKSRLAVWVVWAAVSTMEKPMDSTIGLITPFYNELKCVILLFLLVSRSHGAEAIFLHVIHPILRPYVPAVDDILASLHSMFELLTLLAILPWEYVLTWWHSWEWPWNSRSEIGSAGEWDNLHNDAPQEDGDCDIPDVRRQLRPRTGSRQERLKDVERRARVIFQDIDDAQDKVRTRTRNPPIDRRNPDRGDQSAKPNTGGLRTRKRLLEHPGGLPDEAVRVPGSRSTGVHHIDPADITHLAQSSGSQPFPATTHGSASQPPSHRPPSNPIPTPSSSSQSSHEIWYPPQRSPPLRESTHRTPSPVYPPFPSAYQFTPRRSDPLPPPPHVITPPDLVTPKPRRVSTGVMSRGALDAYEGIDRFPGRSNHAGPSRGARSTEPPSAPQESRGHESMQAKDFFGQALEPPIQRMDMDTETLSTRDGSSATEESTQEVDEVSGMADILPKRLRGHGKSSEPASDVMKGKRKVTTATGPLRRSRRHNDLSSSVETDEFGFTVRSDPTPLPTITVDTSSLSLQGEYPSMAGPSKKKPLARTKPTPKSAQEEGAEAESSDEENEKKRRKVRVDVKHPNLSTSPGDSGQAVMVPNRRGDSGSGTGNAKPDAIESLLEGGKARIRTTRASSRQPFLEQGRARGTDVTRRDRRMRH